MGNMLLEVLHGPPLYKQSGCFGQGDHDNFHKQLASAISGHNHLANPIDNYSGPASNIALLHMALEGLSSTASSSSSALGQHQPSFMGSDSRSSLIQDLLYHNLPTKPPCIISATPRLPHQAKPKGAENHSTSQHQKPSSSSCTDFPLRKMDGEALVAQLMCASCCSTEASSDFPKEQSRQQPQPGSAAMKKETLSASSLNTEKSLGWGGHHHESHQEHPANSNNHGDISNDGGCTVRTAAAPGGGRVNSRNSAEEGSTSCSQLNYTGYSCSVSSSQQLLSAAEAPVPAAAAAPPKRKRKRTRACKNQEEVESQRMTHIAVERNRRKQMNEHLNVLRSLMPPSYIQRGDQASIIGGAIEFVKELEQVLESLQVQKQRQFYEAQLSNQQQATTFVDDVLVGQHDLPSSSHPNINFTCGSMYDSFEELVANSNSTIANVQVKMIGSTAMVKVLAQRTPRQLLHTLSTIEGLHLKVMHLNITTIEDSVLYSFNLQVKEECQIRTASALADSIQHVFRIFNVRPSKIQKVENVCNITSR